MLMVGYFLHTFLLLLKHISNDFTLILQADLNSDGLIDWSEFVAMMTPGDLAKCEQD